MNRLARALLPIAHRALALPPSQRHDDEDLLAAALDSLDGFLAVPTPSRYLIALRALGSLSRLRRRSADVDRLARRSINAELDRLDTRALAGAPIEALRSLPADPRVGRRIQALTALLDAHRELALRVRAPERLRAKVTVPGEHARKLGRVTDRRKRPVARARRA